MGWLFSTNKEEKTTQIIVQRDEDSNSMFDLIRDIYSFLLEFKNWTKWRWVY
jgi:hypothetical protein